MKRILIVDDVPGWVRFHKTNIEYLNIADIEIDSANSAKEALAKLEVSINEPYDVIFTDMQMESDFLPKLAGEWLIEQIQMFNEYKSSKIVIISAAPDISRIAKHYGVLYMPKTVARNSKAEIYADFLS